MQKSYENVYQKLNTYSAQSVDPQIKQLFTKSAQDALNTKQKLMSFLNNNQLQFKLHYLVK